MNLDLAYQKLRMLGDSEAISYPYIFIFKERKIMLYNGNGFGKTGFGYAVLES